MDTALIGLFQSTANFHPRLGGNFGKRGEHNFKDIGFMNPNSETTELWLSLKLGEVVHPKLPEA